MKLATIILVFLSYNLLFAQESTWVDVTTSANAQNPKFVYSFGNQVIVWDSQNTLITSSNNGLNWVSKQITLLNGSISETPAFVYFYNYNVGYAFSTNNYSFRTDDNGNNWLPKGAPGEAKEFCPSNPLQIQFVTENSGFIINSQTNVFYTTDPTIYTLSHVFHDSHYLAGLSIDRMAGFSFVNAQKGYLVGRFKKNNESTIYGAIYTENLFNLSESTFCHWISTPADSYMQYDITSNEVIAIDPNTNQAWIGTNNANTSNCALCGTVYFTNNIWSNNPTWKTYSDGFFASNKKIVQIQPITSSKAWLYNENNEIEMINMTANQGNGNSVHCYAFSSEIRNISMVDENHGWAVVGNKLYRYAPADPGDVVDNISEQKIQSLGIFPNPFFDLTQIKYSLKHSGTASIKLFDLCGNLVKVVLSEEKSAGEHSYNFNSEDLAIGVYNMVLFCNNEICSLLVTIIK